MCAAAEIARPPLTRDIGSLAEDGLELRYSGPNSRFTVLNPKQSSRLLVFLALLERGFWLARRGMVTVSIPVTDAMCDDLVAAFDDVVRTYGTVLPGG